MIASFIEQAGLDSCHVNLSHPLLCQKAKTIISKPLSTTNQLRNIIRTQRIITGKQPNIIKPETMRKQRTMPIWRMATICMQMDMRQKPRNMCWV